MAMVRIDRMKRHPTKLRGPLEQVTLSTASGQRVEVTVMNRESGMFSGDYYDASAVVYDKKGVPVFMTHLGQLNRHSVFSHLGTTLRVQRYGALAKVVDAHAATVPWQ